LRLWSRKRSHYFLKVEADAYTENADNFLLTIPPASIEPERAFSSAGILCSKLRSHMSDAILDNMLFLPKTNRPAVNAMQFPLRN